MPNLLFINKTLFILNAISSHFYLDITKVAEERASIALNFKRSSRQKGPQHMPYLKMKSLLFNTAVYYMYTKTPMKKLE